MNVIGWLVVIIPLVVICYAAISAKKYVRGVADYLAAGRVAGRYVISVGGMQTTLAVITLVGLCEQEYQTGIAMTFWRNVTIPVSIFMSLTGYCIYRYRQTRCLSIGQFLEMRYNKVLRVFAASVRTIAEMLTNAIAPAIAARFFIYFLGFPHHVTVFGVSIPTFMLVVVFVVALATVIVLPGGRISLIITDCFQGLLSYPIFIIFTIFLLCNISWHDDIAPVMLDRAPGESFLNPTEIQNLRDFNIFSLIVFVIGQILNHAAWIGNDTSSAGRTPHEQKMAGVLGAWRQGFSALLCSLIALATVTIMLAGRFQHQAREIRTELANRVVDEVVGQQEFQQKLHAKLAAIPVQQHRIGVDRPYSRESNPDTPYLQTTYETMKAELPDGPMVFQKFRTLYYQMMMPVTMRRFFPPVLMGVFALLMIMLMLSTDDSRIFNAAGTLVQDVVMPLRKEGFTPEKHLWWLRFMTLCVSSFFVYVSLFMSQLDYIWMFISIMTGLWLGAAGPIMVGGLYCRFGTTAGAFAALIGGSGVSLLGLICQRNWASAIYPWLARNGYVEGLGTFLETVSRPLNPLVVWKMSDVKFPINSYEIYFLAMLIGCIGYLLVSWLTYRKPYNLDRMLHRGQYAVEEDNTHLVKETWTWKNGLSKIIGITNEYTLGDKIIAWSVFGYTIVFQFIIAFIGVVIWNCFWKWPDSWWSYYFYFNIIVLGVMIGLISTVWFCWGGIVDLRRLFQDLAHRKENPLDDGRIEHQEGKQNEVGDKVEQRH